MRKFDAPDRKSSIKSVKSVKSVKLIPVISTSHSLVTFCQVNLVKMSSKVADIKSIMESYKDRDVKPDVGEIVRVDDSEDDLRYKEYTFSQVGKKKEWVMTNSGLKTDLPDEEDEEVIEKEEVIEEVIDEKDEEVIEKEIEKEIKKKKSSKKEKNVVTKKVTNFNLDDVINVLDARDMDACEEGLAMLKLIKKHGAAVDIKEKKVKKERDPSKPRIRSGYNIFISQKMKELKEKNPEVAAKERMGAATKFWTALSKDEQKAFEESVASLRNERGLVA